MLFGRTGPTEAASNLSKWIEQTGLHRLATLLRSPTVARRVFRVAAAIMAVLLFIGGIGVGKWWGENSESKFQAAGVSDHRHLTDGEKQKLGTELAKLRTVTTRLALSNTNGDTESDAYAHDFADVVRRAGMEPLWGFALPDDPDQIGVIIALKDLKTPPPETEPLRAALQSVGIEPKILGFPSGGFHVSGSQDFHPEIVLWVAPRPF
jgi:hypothetical protein